jgi:hypothetical protein
MGTVTFSSVAASPAPPSGRDKGLALSGLSTAEATRRLTDVGRNEIRREEATSAALGVGAVYAYSVVPTLVPGLFPASFRMMGEVAVYVVVAFATSSRSRARASAANVDGRVVSIPFRSEQRCRDILERWVG